jgi:predicted O-methyltransferase YrrM
VTSDPVTVALDSPAPAPGAARAQLIDALWAGADPFDGFPADQVAPDMQGWHSDHAFLAETVARLRPRIIVEVGAWKGMSVLSLAAALRDNGIDGVVVAVDTWLGSVEHWVNPDWRSALGLTHGYPTLQRTFMRNVIEAGLERFVVPLPLDSLNAAALLRRAKIAPDIIHIDAGHDFASVTSDLEAWWRLLGSGGVLIGDDYHDLAQGRNAWPGVRRAFNAFFGRRDLLPFEYAGGKCRIVKP